MISESTIYWITRCDAFLEFAKVAMFMMPFPIIFLIMCGYFPDDGIEYQKMKKYAPRIACWFLTPIYILIIIGSVLVPTTKEAA